ncbi:tetratricopeptide repeat protein, partial [bacterium]|nr:tetratricopeptide repeat protein [bacterium]
MEICRKITLEEGDSAEAAIMLNNMGVLQSEMGNNLKSVETLKKGLSMATIIGKDHIVGMCRNNLGGTYGNLERYDEAVKELNASLQIFQRIEDRVWEAMTLAKLARVMRKSKSSKKEQILKYSLRALHLGDSLGQKDLQRRALRTLHLAYNDLGQHEKAYDAYKQFDKVNSELRGEKRRIATVQREAKYEFEKQLALERTKSDQKVALAKANESKQEAITWIFIIGSILLLVIIVLIVQRLWVVKKQKRLIERQNEERKLLLKEIHHRIKNNFQVISSLLRLQASEENNAKIAQAFDDAVLRIQSMASVHELIYKQEMFEALDFQSYLDRLMSSIQSYSTDQK